MTGGINQKKNGWGLNKKITVRAVLQIIGFIGSLIILTSVSFYRLGIVEQKVLAFEERNINSDEDERSLYVTKEKLDDSLLLMGLQLKNIEKELAEVKQDVKQILKNGHRSP